MLSDQIRDIIALHEELEGRKFDPKTEYVGHHVGIPNDPKNPQGGYMVPPKNQVRVFPLKTKAANATWGWVPVDELPEQEKPEGTKKAAAPKKRGRPAAKKTAQ